MALNPISVDLDAQVLVDAYRYTAPGGNQLGDPGWPAEPVIDQAKALVGQPYSYSELLLGALILLEVDDTPQGVEQLLLELAAKKFESELATWIASLRGVRPMTCVQVVTTSYYQAESDPAHKYGLQVTLRGDRQPPRAGDEGGDDRFRQLQARLRRLFVYVVIPAMSWTFAFLFEQVVESFM